MPMRGMGAASCRPTQEAEGNYTKAMATRCLALFVLLAAATSAQPLSRRATNVAALVAYPGFFHLRPIALVGTVALGNDGETRVTEGGLSLHLVTKASAPDGLDEIHGEFWDLGRMNADDPRLASYDLKTTFKIDPQGSWPRPGQVMAIIASSVTPASQPAAPTIRNLVLYPSRYAEQRITVSGQFGGRNLLGDLPDAPAQSRDDFVLRSADAAIWVSNIRPRGKDFELALDARIDTGRWLEVSGTLQQGRGLQWLDATGGRVALASPPKEPVLEAPIRVPAAPPPEVVFSAPIADETDVSPSSTVRIQFSRDIDPATFRSRVRAAYSSAETPDRTEAGPALDLATQYVPGNRVLEIRFRNPLDRFKTVIVELQEGILGTDKQPLAPWTLTFHTGS
jgi:hypothetical protein